MSLPPHLLALQNKLNSLNIPKINNNNNNINNINKNISLKEDESNINTKSKIIENNNIISKNSLKNSSSIENKNNTNIKKNDLILEERKKNWVIYRKGAGLMWEDETLKDWPENDYRIFCGNLGNEVSTQVLTNAFMKYKSFAKAKVIRDKFTTKTKGYGFVSFTDVNDYIKCMKEMNGKYVGNRPIQLKRSTWKDRSILFSKSKIKEAKFIKKRERPLKQLKKNITENKDEDKNKNKNEEDEKLKNVNNNIDNNVNNEEDEDDDYDNDEFEYKF